MKFENVWVRVRLKFGQNAHVRAMCVRPKFECECDPYIRRNSQFELISDKQKNVLQRQHREQAMLKKLGANNAGKMDCIYDL